MVVIPRLRYQTKNRYVQTVSDRKCLCPDQSRRKILKSRLSYVHKTSVRSSPNFSVFLRLSSVNVQNFVHSEDIYFVHHNQTFMHHQTFLSSPDFHALTRFLCMKSRASHEIFSPDFRTFTRYCAFIFRHSRVHIQTFMR